MPNIKSQDKRDRQNLKRAEVNKSLKNKIKTLNRNLKDAVGQKDSEKASQQLKTYFSTLDKAAQAGTVHKNFAANKKSKAANLINTISAVSEEKKSD